MDDSNIFEALGQVSSGEAGIIFRNFLRGSVRHLISEVMAEDGTVRPSIAVGIVAHE